jgi:hypothetical protein
VECVDCRKEKNQLAQTEFRFIKKDNNNKERQLRAVLRLYINVAQQQKMGKFKVAIASRPMQWSALTEKKEKNQLAQTEFRFIKKNNNNKERQLRAVLRLYISVALQQKTGNFKVAIVSRPMQWSALTVEKKRINLRKQSFAS